MRRDLWENLYWDQFFIVHNLQVVSMFTERRLVLAGNGGIRDRIVYLSVKVGIYQVKPLMEGNKHAMVEH